MADSTRVEADALLEFSHRMFERSEEFAESAGTANMAMAGANLGGSDMLESWAAATSYADSLFITQQLLSDVHDGLQALSYVAVTVADHYQHSDADQADQLDTVLAAFSPSPGQASISSQRAAAEATARAQAAAVTPTPTPAELGYAYQALYGVHPTSGSTNNQYSRAADEVAAHNERIGESGVAAENGYDLRPGYVEAQQAADRLSDQFNTPFVVRVDEHGTSEAVSAVPLLPEDLEPDPVSEQTAEESHDQQSADLARALGENG